MLDDSDPAEWEPRRILIAGVTGSGKTTLGRRLEEVTGIPHTDLDGLYHGPGWVPRPEFLDDVRALVAADSWITEWQYHDARPLLLDRADILVWLDPPVRVAMTRLVRRTLRRRWTRAELWNGNTESPLRAFFTDPDHIVRWGWRTRHKYRHTIPAIVRPGLTVVQLRTSRDVERWLQAD